MGLDVGWAQGALPKMRAEGQRLFSGHLEKSHVSQEGGCGPRDFWRMLDNGGSHGHPQRGWRVSAIASLPDT